MISNRLRSPQQQQYWHAERMTNLLPPLTSCIGREREIAEIKTLLSRHRLITLTGPGGCGKTRLAIELAGQAVDLFPQGAWFIDLEALNDPAFVPFAVASTVGLHERTEHLLSDALIAFLQDKQTLLILDNCEHLIEACAQLAELLLRHCPALRVLATSREALKIAGEIAWPLAPLEIPPILSNLHRLESGAITGEGPGTQDVAQYASVRLFLERASAVSPHFALTTQNAPAVADVCRQLDGIPLAIELAAARVKVLPVEQIAERLADCFNLLTIGSRTARPRQQTLRATMDWSYGLLAAEERVLFRRLCVFAGGFTLEAAAEVTSDEITSEQRHVGGAPLLVNSDVLDLLSHLVDKSLVTMGQERDGARYRFLETIGQYACERLLESGEWDQLRRRHLSFFLDWANQAELKLTTGEQLVWLVRLAAERDNLRAALQWSLSDAAESSTTVSAGLELASALWRFWFMRGDFREGRAWLERALACKDSRRQFRTRARLLNGAGCLAWLQADYGVARAWLEESVAICRELGQADGWALALAWLAMVEIEQGNPDAARPLAAQSVELFRVLGYRWGLAHSLFVAGRAELIASNYDLARVYYEESVTLFRAMGDRWAMALPLGHLGIIADRLGQYAAARTLLTERLAIGRELGSKQIIAYALLHLGHGAWAQADYAAARSFYQEALILFRELGAKQYITGVLEGLAHLANAESQYQQAARLFGAAVALRESAGFQLDADQQVEHESNLVIVKSQMGEAEFERAWTEGQTMPLDLVIAHALAETPAPPNPTVPPPDSVSQRAADKMAYGGLTPREREVAVLIAQGKSNRDIAVILVVGMKTVETHVTRILAKLGFTSRAQVAAWVVGKQMVPAPPEADAHGRQD